jgi:tetratricopeptide (TPR) repeat protein
MKTKYLLIICFVICQITLFAQSAEQVKIDSLRKLLPTLKDAARVDCLIVLADAFWGKNDSTYSYMAKANREATKIGYPYGKAMSLLELSRYEMFIKKNLVTARAYVDSATLIGEKIKNDKVLGRAYLTLADVYGNSKIRDKQKILECFIKSKNYFQKAGDKLGELEVTTWLCMDYNEQGRYEEGFEYCEKCVELSKFITPNSSSWLHELVQWSLINMSDIFKDVGDYQTSLEYLKQCNQYSSTNKLSWDMDISLSDMYSQLGQYDSALYYWKQWEKDYNSYAQGHQAYGNNVLGNIYLKMKQYDKALNLFEQSNATFKKGINKIPLSGSFISTSKAYVGKKNWNIALKYATDGFTLAEKDKISRNLIDCYQLLSEIYHAMGKDEQAYANLRQYTVLKDSIINRQFIWRLSNYKKEAEAKKKKAEIELLNKDNQIKDEQLKQEQLLKNVLIIGLAVLIVISVLIFRTLTLKQKNEKLKRTRLENELMLQKLESEKQEAELRQQASELEMQALRAQMSPHFIFNCLSSINRFILKNESETASDYLTRFSRLIRLVLSNSKQSLISLEDELEMIWLYIEMERLRFQNSFDFNITFKNEIDASSIYIPPLLLQPFAENAIWHGLMNKDGDKQLDFSFATNESELICIITDNGVGRQKAQEMKGKKEVKEKSMGLQITVNRLAIFNKESNPTTSFQVEDLSDEEGTAKGTKVTLKIRTKDIWKSPVTLESVA